VRTRFRILLGAVAAGAITLASSEIPASVNVAWPGSEDCERGCDFVAAGWPFAYLVDHPGISPGGSVNLVGGLLGVDLVRPTALAATFTFWLGAVGLAGWALGQRQRGTA